MTCVEWRLVLFAESQAAIWQIHGAPSPKVNELPKHANNNNLPSSPHGAPWAKFARSPSFTEPVLERTAQFISLLYVATRPAPAIAKICGNLASVLLINKLGLKEVTLKLSPHNSSTMPGRVTLPRSGLQGLAMAEFNFSVIYLGNIAELDTIDGNATAENQSALLGTYYSAGDPAYSHIVSLTAQDANSDGLINSNDAASPDNVSFDLGSGPVATQYDALFNANVTVYFTGASGEPPYNGLGGIIQTETGDLFFVMIDDGEGFGSNAFDDAPIESISINSISAFGSQSMATASDTQSFVPCFAAGTHIRTPFGIKPVQNLTVGDEVMTLDNGRQVVTWVGRRNLNAAQISRSPNLAAIHIAAGSLGAGYPKRDLLVSPQHRILLRS